MPAASGNYPRFRERDPGTTVDVEVPAGRPSAANAGARNGQPKRTRGKGTRGFAAATVNGTSWSNIFKYTTECGADTAPIVAQEHRLPQKLIAEQSRRIFWRGWKSFGNPASLTGKATSGGIVIMVRNHSACDSMPGDESIAPGKVTIPVVEAATWATS